MANELVLQTHQLQKHFGPVRAVEDVSLAVPRGQVYGFLGPNGSGKTTTIGMILGLINPTAGQVEVLGQAVTPNQNGVLRRVGALVGIPSLVPYLSARENVALVARLHGDIAAKRIDTVVHMVGLGEDANRAAGKFSTGMKQRLGLAMALVHEPELLILDEPTNGMDPAGMRELRTLLRELADGGTTVFLSSHMLHEVEQICDQVAMLKRGQVVAAGSIKTILVGREVIRLRVPAPSEAAAVVKALPEVSEVAVNGSGIEVSGASSDALVSILVTKGIIPTEVTTVRGDLEDLFLELTNEAV